MALNILAKKLKSPAVKLTLSSTPLFNIPLPDTLFVLELIKDIIGEIVPVVITTVFLASTNSIKLILE